MMMTIHTWMESRQVGSWLDVESTCIPSYLTLDRKQVNTRTGCPGANNDLPRELAVRGGAFNVRKEFYNQVHPYV